MTIKHYEFVIGQPAPELERHSQAKHEILRTYLVRYLRTLVANPRQDQLRVTIIDGFAGGGLYREKATGIEVPGSPIICMEAADEAKALIDHQQQRRKLIRLDVDYFFVDRDPSAIAFLRHTLDARGHQVDNERGPVRVLHGDFNEHADKIIEFVKRKSKRSGRSIFILDQYGYSAVPLATLNKILSTLPRAEIILTFSVDSFITYASAENRDRMVAKTGIADPFAGLTVDQIQNSHKLWRLFIQRNFISGLQSGANARFFTPFFLRPEKGHGDIWLVHLSQHIKARDVMAETHWAGKNFVHPGEAGLDMLGFATKVANVGTDLLSAPEFAFNDIARTRTLTALQREIPERLEVCPFGVSFGAFFSLYCNTTPATRELFAEAVFALSKAGDLDVLTEAGQRRQSAGSISDADVIKLRDQRQFFFMAGGG